jgi:hypothetical protein
MTVHAETPHVTYEGNDVTTIFTFDWTQIDPEDMYVELDGVEQIEGIDYELVDFKDGMGPEDDGGGKIVYPKPLATGQILLIARETPVTQEVDYIENAPFPAETHEMQMDKDTLILQELFSSGRGGSGPVDLEAVPGADFVDITNTAGLDARIPRWQTDTLLAGVFHGEVVAFGQAPVDGTPTTKPDGYIWWELTN